MSDPHKISPLLDGFQLGAPISDHHGVVCCPAIKENTNKKFIVKIISIPASQAQLDALLFAGAYKDPADAMEYFRKRGESILQEASQLKLLSKLEGFLPYDGWQMEPITRKRLGYEIYLVSSYKRSLEKYMKKNAFTHLEAINLGLDLCSALSVCRESGYLYADLKPSNIYVSENKQFRIGDLGFISIDSLRYASLPERYHSAYTPPELLDPMTSMNLTVDTYSVGMILYQLFNDGHLPFTGIIPQQPLPSPVHADYEIADIIMKAIDPDPDKRWADPKEMGKAIASYMQRNRVNDIPITPFIPLDVTPEPVVEDHPQKTKRKKSKNRSSDSFAELNSNTSLPDDTNTTSTEQSASETTKEETQSQNLSSGTVQVCVSDDSSEESFNTSISLAPHSEEDPTELFTEKLSSEEEITEPESVLPAAGSDQPQMVDSPECDDSDLSEEVIQIIAKADDLIDYEIPKDTIFASEQEVDPFDFVFDDSDLPDSRFTSDELREEDFPESTPEKKKHTKHFADTTKKRKLRKFFGRLLVLMILAAAAAASLWFYQNIYLLTIDSMTFSAAQDQITVLIDSDVEESQLTVHCFDSKGNRKTESVNGGKVIFSGLNPSTQYTIQAEISGFHKLTGNTSGQCTTESPTQILTFTAIAGSEDGSVLLEFTVDGEEPDFWNIRYATEGEDEKRETIKNHSTMISGLTVGKVYTFTIDGGKQFDVGGKTELSYMASKLILAENLRVNSTNGSDVTIEWDTPGDVIIDNWKVRCYDGYGFEKEMTVTQTEALLNGLDPAVSYTVDVTASGMTKPQQTTITADPLFVSDFLVDETKHTKMNISWEYTGNPPENGWVLYYSIDGSANQEIECKKESTAVEPLIPGATYHFTLQSADGRTVYNNLYSYTTAAAEPFTENGIIPENLSIDLLHTPQETKWTYESLENVNFSNTFTVGDSVSIVLRSTSTFYLPGYETKILYVFRNTYGNVLTEMVSEETCYWKSIWERGDTKIGELTIPKLPAAPGEYVMELYFNGKSVAQLNMTITD